MSPPATLQTAETPQRTIAFCSRDVSLGPGNQKRYFTKKQLTPVDENREVEWGTDSAGEKKESTRRARILLITKRKQCRLMSVSAVCGQYEPACKAAELTVCSRMDDLMSANGYHTKAELSYHSVLSLLIGKRRTEENDDHRLHEKISHDSEFQDKSTQT